MVSNYFDIYILLYHNLEIGPYDEIIADWISF